MNLPPFGYLLEKSKHSLKDFRLRQLNERSNSWRHARESLEDAIQAEALALLATWIEQYGEELIAQESGEGQVGINQSNPAPSAISSERTYERPVAGREFWRAERKRFYRRAG
jgi:hypothetical protein